MKSCSRCKVVKDDSKFYKNGEYLRAMCKICMLPGERLKRQNTRKRLQLLVESHKNKPCADCNGLFSPWQMDFDHRDSTTKIDDISALCLIKRASVKIILEEIQKCDLVCANCHRDRTHRRYKDVE